MRKNILFILPDQLRADFCGCNGADFIKTPHIDKLAEEGVRYSQAISPSPACVPARASMLTGRSPMENRVIDNTKWLRPDHDEMGIQTWASQLAEKGYHTAAIGKMHFYPWDISEGFQHRVIAEDKRHIEIQDDYTMYLKKHGLDRQHGSECEGYYENLGAVISNIPEQHQIDRYVCDETLSYLDCINSEQPFAMMVGFPGPHCPYDPAPEVMARMEEVEMPKACPITEDSDKLRARNISDNLCSWNGVDITNFTPDKVQKVRLHYAANVQAIDGYVGEIISKLKEMNIYENTIIIFSSDHGDYLGDFGMSGKGHYYESSVRVPLIIRYPGQEPMIFNHSVSLTDLYNTILQFGDIEVEDTMDSTTLAPFGKHEKREALWGSNELGWMLRDDKYQYSVYYNGVRELYDIVNDTQQQTNLLRDDNYSEIAEEMRTELERRVFIAITQGNIDMVAKAGNLNREKGMDPFNYEGWKRPYPYSECQK
ncbi:MAG: sulfatase-like hydrolase/transferase [Eubacteriales bacterium]